MGALPARNGNKKIVQAKINEELYEGDAGPLKPKSRAEIALPVPPATIGESNVKQGEIYRSQRRQRNCDGKRTSILFNDEIDSASNRDYGRKSPAFGGREGKNNRITAPLNSQDNRRKVDSSSGSGNSDCVQAVKRYNIITG